MPVDVGNSAGDRNDVVRNRHEKAGDDRAFLEEQVGDFLLLIDDDVLGFVKFRVQQVAVLVIAQDPTVACGAGDGLP